jgi:hypothetical protein
MNEKIDRANKQAICKPIEGWRALIVMEESLIGFALQMQGLFENGMENCNHFSSGTQD